MMTLTTEQIKGRLKNLANKNNADARILIRIFMMERFLERIANSKYSENFVIKGGILVTSMVGISLRSTMDIDASIHNLNLSKEDAFSMVKDISNIDLGDGIAFDVKNVSNIMEEKEYPGIRIALNAIMGKTSTPIKIDISTGDVITPRAIEYQYKLMLEDRNIRLWSYNLETVLAEKLEAILSRGVLNTRMRDFYDVYTLLLAKKEQIDTNILQMAFEATCRKRASLNLLEQGEIIIKRIEKDEPLKKLWEEYKKKFSYASKITYQDVIDSTKELFNMVIKQQ